MNTQPRQKGFTLIEIALVLLVVTILLGYTVAMFPVQQELKQYRQLDRELDSIVEHLIGFAQINGRLPCPDTSGDVNGAGAGVIDGSEDTDDIIINATGALGQDLIPDDCKAFYGFVPTATLGLTGDINIANGNLLDPWGRPYRYHVSAIDTGAAFGVDLVTPDGIRDEGVAFVVPNLSVCDLSGNPTAADLTCAAAAGPTIPPNPPPPIPTAIIGNAAVIVYSSGKALDLVTTSTNEAENRDGFHNGTLDFLYTHAIRADAPGLEYDDKIRWISPNLLFTRMIEADQLP